MKDRGKSMETNTNCPDFNYSASDMPCDKHPNSSPVGVCAYCLKEKLAELICSECGEQHPYSCSCSLNSSYRNSCSRTEIGTVGRISFLIENEKFDSGKDDPHSKSKRFVFFRSSSTRSCVEIKKSDGFWKMKRLFRKKNRNKGCEKNGEFCDDRSGIWVPDIMGVSKSRSLCSFRGGKNNEKGDCARISDVTGGFMCESESRKCGFRGALSENRAFFPVKESDLSRMDESGFIDLKLDLLSESKQDLSGGTLKRGSRSHSVWKWIFKHDHGAKEER